MQRRSLWLWLYLFAGVAAGMGATEKPNVLFIAIDDLYPTLGCYNDPVAITPQIDSLAAQGTTFLNHHVQYSVCGPSRASLTTGLMPEETGVIGFRAIRHPDRLPDVIFLPQHFRNNGYQTAAVGKFHDPRTVGDVDQPMTDTQGNDPNVSGNDPEQFPDGRSVDDPLCWSIPYSNALNGSDNQPSLPKVNNGNTNAKPAVRYDHDVDADFIDGDIAEKAIGTGGLLDQIEAEAKPFFLAVGFKKPHLAFEAPQKYWDYYDTDMDGNYDDDFPLPVQTAAPANAGSIVTALVENNNEILGYDPYRFGANGVDDGGTGDDESLPDTAQTRQLRHGYYACTSFVDKLVGDLLADLATRDDPVQAGKKMNETTIVVIWGDHGFYLGEHTRWAKHSNLERATRAPLIIYDPRLHTAESGLQGNKTMSPANTIDLYPTLCELAGLPVPEQPTSNTVLTGRPLKGRSLKPVLLDADASVNGGAISFFNQSGSSGYAYRTERYRLIEWFNGSGDLTERSLFEYDNDFIEKVDVAADTEYAAIAYQLSAAMRAEPALQGTQTLPDGSTEPTRLQSTPVETQVTTPADPVIPGLGLGQAPAGQLKLQWPHTNHVTYRVISNTDLSNTWFEVSGFESVAGGDAVIDITNAGDKRFYLVEVDDNHAPQFSSDPIRKPSVAPGVALSGLSIGSDAADIDAGDTLTFQKVGNTPAWISVATDGTLSGTPNAGGADDGANYVTVRVTDNHGASTEAQLQVVVGNSAPFFIDSTIIPANAIAGQSYIGQSIANTARDWDSGDTLTFSKVGGTATWLTVASNGDLGGTPPAGIGTYTATVQVSDGVASYTTELKIMVDISDTVLNFNAASDTYVSESNNTTSYGGSQRLELRDTGSFKRATFLRFTTPAIPAGAMIQSVKLYVTPDADATFAEYDDIYLYDLAGVNGDSWSDASTWDSTPTERGAMELAATPTAHIAVLQNSTGSSDDEQSVDLTSAGLVAADGNAGTVSLGLRVFNVGLGRLSAEEHNTNNGPRLEIIYTAP